MSTVWLMSVWCFAGVVLLIILIIREAERTKRELHTFINAVSYGEFKGSYISKNKNDDLSKAFEALKNVYSSLRIEKEKNLLYLKTIVEHINIVLLCFDENEDIVILNETAKKFFERNYIINLNVIQRFDNKLSEIIHNIKGGQKKLYKFQRKGSLYDVSVHATEFKLQEAKYKLVSIQDVRFELEEQELDAWRKLVRVLTHEIMNTAIPISTLAGVTNQLLTKEDGSDKVISDLDQEDQDDLRQSLKTIEKRSKGMVDFVKATKSYTNMPVPKFELADIHEIIENVVQLLKPGIGEHIGITIRSSSKLPKLQLDVKLIEQLFINLIKNAIEAIPSKSKGNITIVILEPNQNSTLKLEIIDDGKGIEPEVLENIFIPFYTTKSEGSGIGLSLSKQIMKLHHGDIMVSSIQNQGTKIELSFPI